MDLLPPGPLADLSEWMGLFLILIRRGDKRRGEEENGTDVQVQGAWFGGVCLMYC